MSLHHTNLSKRHVIAGLAFFAALLTASLAGWAVFIAAIDAVIDLLRGLA